MNALTTSLLLQLSMISAGPQTYAQAHQESMESGKPLLVLVGANWCPACVEMKSTVLPELRRRGVLEEVEFAQIDIDRQRGLAREISTAGTIPQLVLYRKTESGWKRWELIGGQSPESVEQFLANGRPEQGADPTASLISR